MESRVIHRLHGSVPERHPGRVRDRREASPARMPLPAAPEGFDSRDFVLNSY